MVAVEKSIEVNVPVKTAYNQWTQFEEFPRFMEGVESVEQIDDRRMHWRANIGGVSREWDAEISEQRPDERVAWHSTDGATNAGVVTFHYVQPYVTKVMLQLDFEPHGITENIGDKLGFVSRKAEGDLQRFKTFIEARGDATGGWRGEVKQEKTR